MRRPDIEGFSVDQIASHVVELDKYIDKAHEVITKLRKKVKGQSLEIKGYEVALEMLSGYVKHHSNCDRMLMDEKCTCGLDKILK